MRLLVFFVASLACLCRLEAFGSDNNEEYPRRELQDQSICLELERVIDANTTAMDIQDSCDCVNSDEGDTRLACRRNKACISSDGGDPMQGDFSAIYIKDSEGSSFTQTITSEICFQYPSEMFDGEKVCVSNVRDGFGTVSTCQIQVGSDFCSVCRYCPINLISFDCTNLGYEDRTACGDNNTDDSILQFLYEPELVSGCAGSGESTSGGSMLSPTSSPPGGAFMINGMMAILLCTTPLFWLG